MNRNAPVAAGAPCHYYHPERMEIVQPRVARNELPWDGWSKVSYPERVVSERQNARDGSVKMLRAPGQRQQDGSGVIVLKHFTSLFFLIAAIACGRAAGQLDLRS